MLVGILPASREDGAVVRQVGELQLQHEVPRSVQLVPQEPGAVCACLHQRVLFSRCLHRPVDDLRVQRERRREQLVQRGEGRGRASLVVRQHDDGEVAEVLPPGEGGEEGAQEAERELRAVEDQQVVEHLVEVLVGILPASREDGAVVRQVGELQLQQQRRELGVLLCPYRLGKGKKEVFDVDNPTVDASEKLVVDGRVRDIYTTNPMNFGSRGGNQRTGGVVTGGVVGW